MLELKKNQGGYAPDELLRAISELKIVRQSLQQELQTLRIEHEIQLKQAFKKVQEVHPDQADIHFSNHENGALYRDRMIAVIKSMVGIYLYSIVI